MKKQRCTTKDNPNGNGLSMFSGKIFFFLFFVLLSFQSAFSQFRVIGYVPSWGGNLNDVQYTKLTHINYAFLIPTSNGGYQGVDGNRLSSLVSLAHANGVKVIISVGGGGGGDAFRSIVPNASLRTTFVNNMVSFCNQYNLDGTDIDWEYPSDGAEANNFALMMQELANAMHSRGKLCTAAVIAYGGSSITNAVFNAVDFLNIMSYDENNFQHATYDAAVKAVNYWVGRGLPVNKTVLGVPFYGRDNRYDYMTVGYSDILKQGGSPNADVFQTIGYNGIPTMKKKTQYALTACGGIMIWSLDTDTKDANSLLSAINDVIVANSNPVPDNLAKGKTVTVSSTEASTTNNVVASNATDGSYNTRWGSLFADPQWLYVDLGANCNVNRVKITWEAACAKDYKIQISSDASNWSDVKSIAGNTTLVNDQTSLTATGRYVRIYGTSRATAYGYSIYELEVYGNVLESPYTGTPISLPGTIQAENYDIGGQGLAYNDIDAANQGAVYRTDGVDIQATTDAGGGYNVGWTADGEWMKYMVNVTTSGNYNIDFRTASGAGAIRMEVDGIDVTGTVNLPNTGAYQTWATTTATNVFLSAGNHTIRLYVVTGGFNLNYVAVTVPVIDNGPGFLHASGKNIVNKNGNYIIKAINLGNFMVQEGYMLNLGGGYQHIVKQKIADVVGATNRDKFYDDYLANYITKADIDSLAKWGFNSVRLPMHYNLFTPLGQQDVYIEKGFTIVDNILGWCKANNMYLILDLHAAPGGQSSGDISDYVSGQPSLWESQANRDQTVKLWRKFAERYANEQYIGGYDLINETNWTLPNNNALLMQIMKDITTAIRQVDNNHIVFIEGNSYANDYNGMTPKWDNNMAYSFHKYWNDCTQGTLNFVLAIRDGQNVPIWMGEFGENSNNWIADAVTLMNNNNIGWAIWPYKKMSSVSSVGSFKQPANWTALANYINGGANPGAAVGQSALDELIQNVKAQNCTVNYGYLRALFKQPGNTTTAPFANVNLPGRVAAANYDEGKQGYAYSDAAYQNTQYGSTAGSSNAWNTGWYYRNDGVDLQFSTAENAPTVGYTENGEWMQYTANVAVAGTYTVKVRVAGNGGALSFSNDGTTIFTNAAIPSTGGWDVWQTVTLGNVNLTAGKHTFRATISTAGYNLSYFDFSTQTIVRAPYTGTPVSIPGKVEAENYDLGGQNLAYNDSEPANQGGAYRTDGVDIQATTDAGAGYNVAYTAAGEWMEYSVRVTATGSYDVDFRVATTATGKKIHLEKGGQNISGSLDLPNTAGWQTWQTVTVKNISLTQGDQILRVVFETDGINLNFVNFVTSPVANVLPTASITAPTDSTVVTLPATVTVSANATDSDGTISKVEFFNGSTLLGTVTTSPYTLNLTNPAAGNYSITAKATDNRGGTATSTAVRVIVKPAPNTAPTASITSPANNASFTAPASITINANASDADGSVTKVEFYNGSTKLGEDVVAPYSYAWSNVAAGTYSITVNAIDDKGAITTSSAVSVTVAPQTTCNPVIWSDEFNSTSLDLTKWSYQTGDGCPGNCGWGNNELEYYTSTTNNVSVAGGSLALTARYEPNYNGTGKNYTSGKLVSAGKYSHLYGKFEARIKIPSAQGVWPAFWLLPDGGGWPQNGEIDILETINRNSNWYGTLHYGNSGGTHLSSGTSWTPPSDLSGDYHLYAADWTKDQITFYVDGVNRGTVTKSAVLANGGVWPFDSHKFYIIMNVAVGGNWPGAPTSSQYPVSMLVDYVRVYDNTPCTVTEAPYGGVARNIPGKIEAEDYDLGGEGISYHDVTATNDGGVYRTDAVDIEASTDTDGGYDVGWNAAGEYLKYMVNVAAGTYKLDLRVASTSAGNTFHVELDGQNISGTVTVPNTGGWQTWQTVSVNTTALTAGQNRILKVVMDGSNFNLNYLNFSSTTTNSNQTPTVALTGPANNSTFNAPANISITANASDADGSVAKVEFFNGSTKLGEDAVAPYSFAWNNVAAGTYSITAKVTDNQGATSTSSAITVNVNTVASNLCTNVPQYVENGGYVDGSKVQISGSLYQCKPYPYSGWCNGASWAYAPGTGAYWQDAWTLVGSCSSSARMATTSASTVDNSPNPFTDITNVEVVVTEPGDVAVKVYDKTGQEVGVVFEGYLTPGTYNYAYDASNLKADLYLIKYNNGTSVATKKVVKTE